jgi:ribosome-associated protein
LKIKVDGVRRISISGDFIRLDALLKFASVASTGGEAKIMIQEGSIRVNGEPCLMRGKKIRPGDSVGYGDNQILLILLKQKYDR